MASKHFFVFIALLCCLFFKQDLSAQLRKLKDIDSIKLKIHGGGMSSYQQRFEIIHNDRNWYSYRTLKISGFSIDSARKLIRVISNKKLNDLLKAISPANNNINIHKFNLHKPDLVKFIDSIKLPFPETERKHFIKAIYTDSLLKSALFEVLNPIFMDDANYYGLVITDKTGKKDTIESYSFANNYDLPWAIHKTRSYNPDISLIFNYLMGNDVAYSAAQHKFLNKRIVRTIYWREIMHRKRISTVSNH